MSKSILAQRGDSIHVNVMSTNIMNQLNHVYIGKNKVHHGKQYGLFTKQAADVIFSQNKVYSFRPSSSSIGGGIGLLYGPSRVWFLFNEVYDANLGIRSGEDSFAGITGPSDDIYLIGNIIYDIRRTKGQNGGNTGVWRSGTAVQIWSGVNEEILTLEKDLTTSEASGLNIAVRYYPSTTSEIYLENTSGFSAGDYIDYNHEGTPRRIGGITSDSKGNKLVLGSGNEILSGIRPSSICNWGSNTDLKWDLQLTSSSLSAVDSGVAHTAYDTFNTLYGIDLKKDIANNIRPQGSNWDIGAYEYVP